MTRHDHGPTSPLDDYLTQFGERYADAITNAGDATVPSATPARPRNKRYLPVVGIGGVLSTAAIAYAIVALPVGNKLDVVQEASAALGSAGQIVHYRTVVDEHGDPGSMPAGCTGEGLTTEVWQTTSGPTHWREVISNFPGPPCPPNGPDGKQMTGVVESAQHGRILTSYYRDLGLLGSTRLKAAPPTGTNVYESLVGGNSRDFVPALKALLASGKMRVSGTTHDAYGHQAISLVSRVFRHYPANARRKSPNLDLTRTTTYVVDAKTFTPLHLDETDVYVRDAGPYKGTYRNVYGARFEVYERLASTPENEANLDIHPSGPTVSHLPDVTTPESTATPAPTPTPTPTPTK